MRTLWIAWALTLGLALALTAGIGALTQVASVAPERPGTQDLGTDTGTDAGPGTDPGTLDEGTHEEPEVVTIGVAVRWGYLDGPAYAVLEGRWRFNETRTGGMFLGRWHIVDGEASGFFGGHFTIPDDGHGRFRGRWNFTDSENGGFLAGAWVRVDRGHGFFKGRWNFSDGTEGGVLAGMWAALSEEGGGLRGRAIAASSFDALSWDGYLSVSNGTVEVVRTIRWETGGDREHGTADEVLTQGERNTVSWRSTTTVNWDGLLLAIRVPKVDPTATVTLHTEQASFEWAASTLPGLHVREVVDEFGHAIEIRAFLVEQFEGHAFAAFGVGLRWGTLDASGRDEPGEGVTWEGRATVSAGGLKVVFPVSFERGDQIVPREDRAFVAWSTTTTTGWDGLVLVAFVPLDVLAEATFSVHLGDFAQTWTFEDLVGYHRIPLDDAGHELEVHAVRM